MQLQMVAELFEQNIIVGSRVEKSHESINFHGDLMNFPYILKAVPMEIVSHTYFFYQFCLSGSYRLHDLGLQHWLHFSANY